jgi:autotransporter-associated beta strand protein
MLKYGYAQRAAADALDRRAHPLEPTQASIDAVRGWLMVHLSTLDRLDGADGGGRRLATFLADSGALAALQPLIADGLLSSRQVRAPERTFSLFTWLDNGGIVMDWLIAGIEDAAAGAGRIPTGIVSTAAMAEWLTGGTITLGSGALTAGDSSITTLASAISGAGSFAKQGSGTLTLTAANGYTGGTTVSAGTLQLGVGGSLANTRASSPARVP